MAESSLRGFRRDALRSLTRVAEDQTDDLAAYVEIEIERLTVPCADHRTVEANSVKTQRISAELVGDLVGSDDGTGKREIDRSAEHEFWPTIPSMRFQYHRGPVTRYLSIEQQRRTVALLDVRTGTDRDRLRTTRRCRRCGHCCRRWSGGPCDRDCRRRNGTDNSRIGRNRNPDRLCSERDFDVR